MQSGIYVKFEAFGDMFPSGRLSGPDLIGKLYPGYDMKLNNYTPNAFYQHFAKESVASGGVFMNSRRNAAMIGAKDDDVSSLAETMERLEVSTSGGKNRRTATDKIEIGLVNGPIRTIKSRLGELVTIIVKGPEARYPNEKKHISRSRIAIPTGKSTDLIDSSVTKPTVSTESDIESYAQNQVNMGALDDINVSMLHTSAGGYSVESLKRHALSLGIQVTGLQKPDLIRVIREKMIAYGRIKE